MTLPTPGRRPCRQLFCGREAEEKPTTTLQLNQRQLLQETAVPIPDSNSTTDDVTSSVPNQAEQSTTDEPLVSYDSESRMILEINLRGETPSSSITHVEIDPLTRPRLILKIKFPPKMSVPCPRPVPTQPADEGLELAVPPKPPARLRRVPHRPLTAPPPPPPGLLPLPAAEGPAPTLLVSVSDDDEDELYELRKIELTFSKRDLFLRGLGEWYKLLQPHRKRRLTAKILRVRATHEANKLQLVRSRIPLNWVQILIEDYGLEIHQRHRFRSASDAAVDDKVKDRLVVGGDEDDGLQQGSVGENGEKLIFTACGRKVTAPKQFQMEPFVTRPKPKKQQPESGHDGEASTSKISTDVEQDSGTDKTAEPHKPRFKKLVDLTNEPSPMGWDNSFARNRIAPGRLSRCLTICSSGDQNILFYDYTISGDFYDEVWNQNNDQATLGLNSISTSTINK